MQDLQAGDRDGLDRSESVDELDGGGALRLHNIERSVAVVRDRDGEVDRILSIGDARNRPRDFSDAVVVDTDIIAVNLIRRVQVVLDLGEAEVAVVVVGDGIADRRLDLILAFARDAVELEAELHAGERLANHYLLAGNHDTAFGLVDVLHRGQLDRGVGADGALAVEDFCRPPAVDFLADCVGIACGVKLFDFVLRALRQAEDAPGLTVPDSERDGSAGAEGQVFCRNIAVRILQLVRAGKGLVVGIRKGDPDGKFRIVAVDSVVLLDRLGNVQRAVERVGDDALAILHSPSAGVVRHITLINGVCDLFGGDIAIRVDRVLILDEIHEVPGPAGCVGILRIIYGLGRPERIRGVSVFVQVDINAAGTEIPANHAFCPALLTDDGGPLDLV